MKNIREHHLLGVKFYIKSILFEACSASITVRATDLIGIYESDNR